MIRINLLPQAGKKKGAAAASSSAGGGQGWLIGYLVAVVATCAGLFAVYYVQSNALEEKVARNTLLEQQNNELRQKSARLEEVEAALQRSLELEEVVTQLNRERLGPTRVMMELSNILSVNRGPTIDPVALDECRRLNPLCGFNRSWDPRRLWMTAFEEDNRDCKIRGTGKTNEDVAEFLRRLSLSEVFENVLLEKTEAVADPETSLTLIDFDIACRVRY